MSGMTKDQKQTLFDMYRAHRQEVKKVRESLYEYVRKTVLSRPNYVDGAHIKKICGTIETFLKDPTKQILILSTPPRHMKSTIMEALITWYLSNNPQQECIVGSYNQTQARKQCRSIRMNFDTEEHRHYFPSYVFEVDTADEFMIKGKRNGRPSLISAGVGSGLTGSGADLVVLDDTVKDFQDACSSTIRENIVNWYRSVVCTRLSPGGKIILVQTRWHYQDLPGVVMEESDPDIIMSLNLPAIDDEGRPLWKERYDLPVLEKIRKQQTSRIWNSLYMGRPTPQEGGMFKRDWIREVFAPFPANAHRIRYWDKASTHDGGDWTVGCLMAEYEGRYCIEDCQRIQGSSYEVEQLIRKTAERDKQNFGDIAIYMEQEPGSSGADVISHYSRTVLQGFNFRAEKVSGDKVYRAETLASAMENGNVDMLHAPWNRVLCDELAEFPYGAHDDICDSLSGCFRNIEYTGDPVIVFF